MSATLYMKDGERYDYDIGTVEALLDTVIEHAGPSGQVPEFWVRAKERITGRGIWVRWENIDRIEEGPLA